MIDWTDADVMDKIDRVRWITHNSTSPPELAPAALVEVIFHIGDKQFSSKGRVDALTKVGAWKPAVEYRPITNDEGHKLISAEGLEDWAVWVSIDEDGAADQWGKKPYPLTTEGCWLLDDVGYVANAPSTHRHPGDWRDSLYRVEGR